MAIDYVPYYPDTVEGQAILNNFVRSQRLLKYRDNNRIVSSVKRGMPVYESILEEVVGNPDSGNYLIRGECLSACAFLKKRIDAGEMKQIDLVYIDPPFASGANYAKQVYLRRDPERAAEAANAEQQLDDDELRMFEEVMYGDIWDKERYLSWMHENLMAIKSVMAENASIYVHLDYHIGSYVKILLDEVFGENAFRSEIIWKRSTAHSDSSGFASLHDTIYYYALGDEPYFEVPYIPYSQEYIDSHYNHIDEDGRRYLDRDLSAKGLSGGGYTYSWKGKEGYWRCPETTMQRYEQENRLYYTRNGTPRYKQYMDEMPGMPAQDLWTDVYAVNSQADERVDYSTQKPESLIKRIVEASSDKGMLVADFFGGSGTTAAVCAKTDRNFIHVDVGVNSIQTARQRLLQIPNTSFDVYEIFDGVSLYRNPEQTMSMLKELIPGLCNEDALDKFWEGSFRTPTEGVVPVYIPNLTDTSTKFLDKVLMLRIINEAMPDLPDGTKRVVVFYVDVVDEDELREFVSEYNDTGIDIELRDLKPLLADAVVEDVFTYDITEDSDNLFERFKTRITSFSSDRLERKIDEFNMKGALLGKKSFTPISVSEEGLELIESVSLDCTNSDGIWHADSEIFIDKNGHVIKDGRNSDSFWDGTVLSTEKPKRIKVRNISGDESIAVVTA